MDTSHQATDLRRALAAIGRTQGAWLRDLRSTCAGDPGYRQALRRWREALILLSLHLLRAEDRLLHFLQVPSTLRRRQLLPSTVPGDIDAAIARWETIVPPYLHSLRIPTSYLRLDQITVTWEEPAVADISTDLAIMAAVAGCTGAVLERLDESLDHEPLEELSFYGVLAPWKIRGSPALTHVRRWLDERIDADLEL